MAEDETVLWTDKEIEDVVDWLFREYQRVKLGRWFSNEKEAKTQWADNRVKYPGNQIFPIDEYASESFNFAR